jgi:predicted O-methyltransferase YrrM
MLLIKRKWLRQLLGVAETANFLFLRLALKRKSKCREFPGMVFRDYMSLIQKDKWQCKEIFDIVTVPAGARITLEHLPGKGINTPLDELAYLALLTRAIKPKNIFEIGTFRGRTALNFALNSPEDCTIWTLDLPQTERDAFVDECHAADSKIVGASITGEDYKGKDCEHKIKQLFGNSVNFDFSPFFGKMDLVFVDGAHHYPVVKADTANALKMIHQNGAIVWHDFANYGDYNDVTRAVLDMIRGEEVIQVSNSQLAVYRRSGT